MNPRPSDRLWIAAILAVALLLRAALVLLDSDRLADDIDAYRQIARQLAAGHGFAGPGGEPTAYRPPLFPLLIAAVMAVGGGPLALGAVHVLLGVPTVWLTYDIGRRLALGRGALAAAALVAIDPLLLQYTIYPMTEVLCAILIALLLWFLTSPNRRADAPSQWSQFAAGVAFGLAALCRPTIWVFAMMAILWWAGSTILRWRQDRERWSTATNIRRLPWLVVLGASIIVAPWLLRNLLVFGQPILTTTHGGYTLLLGNNPVFYREVVAAPWGTTWQYDRLLAWQSDLHIRMNRHTPPVRTEPEQDQWMYDEAWRNIAADPEMFVRAAWLRLRRFWNVAPLESATNSVRALWQRLCGRIAPAETCRESADAALGAVRWGVAAFYICVTAAMVLGLARLTRHEWPIWISLVLLIASFTLVHLAYWSNTRMRAPLVPAISLLAARGFYRSARGSTADADRRGEPTSP